MQCQFFCPTSVNKRKHRNLAASEDQRALYFNRKKWRKYRIQCFGRIYNSKMLFCIRETVNKILLVFAQIIWKEIYQERFRSNIWIKLFIVVQFHSISSLMTGFTSVPGFHSKISTSLSTSAFDSPSQCGWLIGGASAIAGQATVESVLIRFPEFDDIGVEHILLVTFAWICCPKCPIDVSNAFSFSSFCSCIDGPSDSPGTNSSM